jgi:uncharacterized protein (DUF2249 family)
MEQPMNAAKESLMTAHPFDARGIGKRFRHAAIFGALDALTPGEAMRFVNDHDPLPLLAQLRERYADALSIQYRQREAGAVVIDFTLLEDDAGQGSTCCGSCG